MNAHRLGAISAHVTAGDVVAAVQVPKPETEQQVTCPPLTDAQLKTFLRDGVLVIKVPEHEFAHNQRVYEAARQGVEEIRSLGGDYNINLSNAGKDAPDRRFTWADLPEVSDVCQAPTFVGALGSILGPGYTMHPHRALHNNGGNRDQMLHKDDNHVGERDHRPRWIMGLWYPTAVTLAMGPTAVSTGSQFLSVDNEAWVELTPDPETAKADINSGSNAAWSHVLAARGSGLGGSQRKLDVEAGSIALIHFDILHRGTAQAFADVDVDGPLPFAIDPAIPWRPMCESLLSLWSFRQPSATQSLLRRTIV